MSRYKILFLPLIFGCSPDECSQNGICVKTGNLDENYCRNADGTCSSLSDPKLCYFQIEIQHSCLDTSLHQIDSISQCQNMITGECIPNTIHERGVRVKNPLCRSLSLNRAFILNTVTKWSTRVTDKIFIPYTYSDNTLRNREGWGGKPLYEAIEEQVEAINQNTCFHLYPETNHDNGFHAIRIQCDGSGCNSPLGIAGWVSNGYNDINICQNCDYTFVHEVGHSLGFKHEQSRGDRGTVASINWRHFGDRSWLAQWTKSPISANENQERGYDFNSDMHYFLIQSNEARVSDIFSQTVHKTKTEVGFSYQDLHLLNKSYKCNSLKFPRNRNGYLFSPTDDVDYAFGSLSNENILTIVSSNFGGIMNQYNGKEVGLIFPPGPDSVFNIFVFSSQNCAGKDGNNHACALHSPINTAETVFGFRLKSSELTSNFMLYNDATESCLSPTTLNEVSCTQKFSTANTFHASFAYITYNDGGFKFNDYFLIEEGNFCQVHNGFCSDSCQESGSGSSFSRTCTCPDGYEIDSDNKSCVEINECDSDPCGGSFSTTGVPCLNYPGREIVANGYSCRCDWASTWNDSTKQCENPTTSNSYFTLSTGGVCLTFDHETTNQSGQEIDDITAYFSTCDSSAITQVFYQDGNHVKSLANGKCLSIWKNDNCDSMVNTQSGNFFSTIYRVFSSLFLFTSRHLIEKSTRLIGI